MRYPSIERDPRAAEIARLSRVYMSKTFHSNRIKNTSSSPNRSQMNSSRCDNNNLSKSVIKQDPLQPPASFRTRILPLKSKYHAPGSQQPKAQDILPETSQFKPERSLFMTANANKISKHANSPTLQEIEDWRLNMRIRSTKNKIDSENFNYKKIYNIFSQANRQLRTRIQQIDSREGKIAKKMDNSLDRTGYDLVVEDPPYSVLIRQLKIENENFQVASDAHAAVMESMKEGNLRALQGAESALKKSVIDLVRTLEKENSVTQQLNFVLNMEPELGIEWENDLDRLAAVDPAIKQSIEIFKDSVRRNQEKKLQLKDLQVDSLGTKKGRF